MEPSRARELTLWVLGAMAVATAVGTVVGTAAGLVVLTSGGRDGWDDLAAVATGLVLGFGAAVLTWLAGVVAVVRRFRPPGRRLGAGAPALLASLLVPLLVMAVLGIGPV